ncbi:S-adenosyl-L-methionine-dependent methyltransferase [Podospora appendiculata]|uniref:S-adenosyl-L-methionine-dependent methyltransferase n=1 Tax=Podospora appendiculata TaxID=314037 RepID=A0AAE0X6F8_9PEZI|nr:S-adenosyl-L-methionine-dependent methyltransferase [Podospora appendiculata]
MPRLPPSFFWQARDISPLAASLLKTCRDLPSALNELRWLREHATAAVLARNNEKKAPSSASCSSSQRHNGHVFLQKFCARRARGEPLQYILGSQPFGDLDIQCRHGVLIPRPETEAYTMRLASILLSEARNQPQQQPPPPMRIIDVCTGTGCIALQLFHALQPAYPTLHVSGIDISPKAISLAHTNLDHNNLPPQSRQSPTTKQTQIITFHQADIFSPNPFPSSPDPSSSPLDLLISNPPYISQQAYRKSTARSVRNHEPALALVPGPHLGAPNQTLNIDLATPHQHADVFYARLLSLAADATAQPRRILFEVADLAQAERVVGLVAGDARLRRLYGAGVEVWRDWPDGGGVERVAMAGLEVAVRGEGHGRAVYLCRAAGG